MIIHIEEVLLVLEFIHIIQVLRLITMLGDPLFFLPFSKHQEEMKQLFLAYKYVSLN